MSDLDYTYAVARIRAKEPYLFSSSVIEQLIAAPSHDQALKFLAEKGWGNTDIENDPEAVLECERQRTWELVRELVKDMSVFDVMTYPNLFHNLKAAIKSVGTDEENPRIFYADTAISGQEMVRIIRDQDFYALPEYMQQAAREGTETFLHTKDGQLLDSIVDRACLDAVYAAGEASDAPILKQYAESTVAVSDIKIAVRAQKTGKSLDFLRKALSPCRSLSTERLAQSAIAGPEAIMSYLEGTAYAEGAKALSESPSAFERWCDNQIIETIRPQKYNPFSVGPIVAYAIARENEIKTVRIILTAKRNNLPEGAIRERVREMYV